MKKLIVLLTFVNCFVLFVQTDEDIADIRNKYKIIEKAVTNDTYKVTVSEFECEDYGVYFILTHYYDGDNLRKIYLVAGHDESATDYHFYIWDDKLFFVFKKYQNTQYTDTGMNLHFTENRYYFKDEESIRCLEKYYVNTYEGDAENVDPAKVENVEISCDTEDWILKLFRKISDPAVIKDGCSLRELGINS